MFWERPGENRSERRIYVDSAKDVVPAVGRPVHFARRELAARQVDGIVPAAIQVHRGEAPIAHNRTVRVSQDVVEAPRLAGRRTGRSWPHAQLGQLCVRHDVKVEVEGHPQRVAPRNVFAVQPGAQAEVLSQLRGGIEAQFELCVGLPALRPS